jgi:hypothetical protein
MQIGIAILTDTKIHNIARNMIFDLHQRYNAGIENAFLPQHISLKQSFPYNGTIGTIADYFEEFCSNTEPVQVLLENVEIKLINEDTILGWMKVKECKELRNIHLRLCEGLKLKFDIDPLGFDGDEWRFHSTLIVSKIDKRLIQSLIREYDNKNISIGFETKKAVMFCNIGDPTKTSEYFTLKIFDMGK